MMNVMIIDDEKTIRTGLTGFVNRLDGFRVVATCRNGAEALPHLDRTDIDIVITDIRMPQMDGLAFMSRCLHLPFRPLMIVISGYPSFEYAQSAIQLETFDYVLKPIHFSKFKYVLLKAADAIRERKATRLLLMDQLGALLTQPDSASLREQSAKLFDRLSAEWTGSRHVFAVEAVSGEPMSEPRWRDIRSFLADRLSDYGGRRVLHFRQDGRIGLIVNVPDDPAFDAESLGLQLAADWQSAMPAVGVMIGYGGGLSEAAHLPALYRQAVLATYERLHRGDLRFAAYAHARDGVRSFEHLAEAAAEKLAALAKSGDREQAGEVVRHFAEQMQRHNYPPELYLMFHRRMLELCKRNPEPYYRLYPSIEAWREQMAGLIDEYILTLQEKKEDPYSALVKRAIQFIRQHYMEDIGLQDIEKALKVNRSYFCKVFKDETGVTYTHYLNDVRIDKAKKLLRNENLKTYEIASLTGFQNEKYFFKVFKEKTGYTPREYVEAAE